jgi:uncharacterized protein
MIVGPFIDAGSVLVGGSIGAAIGTRIRASLRETMMIVFGVPSMAMGIIYIVKTATLPAVVLSTILGVIIGELIFLERGIGIAGQKVNLLMTRLIPSSAHAGLSDEEFLNRFVAILVLFCASGTGIFGAMNEGMTGDSSVLVAKSILDLFTALIFATSLGYATATIAVPQVIILVVLAFAGSYIVPITTPTMRADFTAVGGVLMLANGMRISAIKSFPVADMIPAMVLAMPISALWKHLS